MNMKRLMKEYKDLQKTESDIILEPVSDDFVLWEARIQGHPDSPYRDGKWKIEINVPSEYPSVAPKIRFKTPICHPNIDFKSGNVCLDLLTSQWSPTWTLHSTIMAVGLLLNEPEISSPLNCDAANLLRIGDKRGYESLVRYYTKEYAIERIQKSKDELKKAIAKTSKPPTAKIVPGNSSNAKPLVASRRQQPIKSSLNTRSNSTASVGKPQTPVKTNLNSRSSSSLSVGKPASRVNSAKQRVSSADTEKELQDEEGKVTVAKIVSKNNVKPEDVATLRRVRLDRLNILNVEGLTLLSNLTHLYLQHNNISEFPDLDLPNLDFLILSHNKLEKIALTKCKLNLVDLESNSFTDIENINLPKSVEYFILRGNKCCEQIDYRIQTISKFPNILELDETLVSMLEKNIVNKRMQLESNIDSFFTIDEEEQEHLDTALDTDLKYKMTMKDLIEKSRERRQSYTMQSEHLKLVELLTLNKNLDPAIFERQAIQDYLNHITASTLDDLNKEPEELKQERTRLEKQWTDITCTEYKAFIEANEHFEEVTKQFKVLSGVLDTVGEHIPTIEQLMNDTEKCHLENIATRKNLQLISSQLDNLEPILEIPTLFDTLIRNGHYEEAMELQLFTQRLPIRYPNVPFFEDLASSKNSSHTMLLQLLSMLRGSVKLPICIRVISYLRRMGIKDKTLKILFLTLRQDHLNSLLALVKENQPNDYVRRWIETQRECLLDLVTHYKAIFPNTTNTMQECPILCSFASYSISKLLTVLDDFLAKVQDISLLPSINTQVMYYGMSLGRVGLDFRPIVVSKFESTTKKLVHEMLHEISKSFHITEVQIERPKKDLDNQDFLMKSSTVALTYNKYMTVLNQIRNFPCKALHPDLSLAFIESLSAIAKKILEHHSKYPRDAEIISWIFVDGLLPGVVPGLDKVLDGPLTDYSGISNLLNDLKETAIAHGVQRVSEVQIEQVQIEEGDEEVFVDTNEAELVNGNAVEINGNDTAMADSVNEVEATESLTNLEISDE
ncbi:hypothetical protein HDV06_003102 [Boothiomyces sp. JEL0866]|nr:hypothetical protein HDV06_003102 [Boothiomyces sp. JEL0866]